MSHMKIRIILTLAAIALAAGLGGCMSEDEQADWQGQQQIRNAQREQNQAQIQADRVQQQNSEQYGQ